MPKSGEIHFRSKMYTIYISYFKIKFEFLKGPKDFLRNSLFKNITYQMLYCNTEILFILLLLDIQLNV